MKNFRILTLHFNHIIEYRARAFVYFLMSLINPFILIFFWSSVSAGDLKTGWNLTDINSYYLLLVIASGLLIAHIEHDVAFVDIKEGMLSQFLLKPYSYYVLKFMDEITFRIMRSIYSIGTILLIVFAAKISLNISSQPSVILLSVLIAVLAFIISFTFKITIALFAFWIDEMNGFFELVEVAMVVFMGNIMPIFLYPEWLKNLASALPFSYIIYFPVIAFQGKLQVSELFQVIAIQLFWILVFAGLYKILWARGIKKYSGIGQ